MHELAGQRVVVRFDPVNFWDGLHVYAAGGGYLGHAPVRQKVGFFDADEARAQRAMKAIRDAMRVVGSKTYIRCYRRAVCDGAWEAVTIDLAKA